MFDIYFQNGEFAGSGWEFVTFISDLFVQVIGTLIGAAAAAFFALRHYQKQIDDQKLKEVEATSKFDFDKLRFLKHLILGSKRFVGDLLDASIGIIGSLDKEVYSIPQLHVTAHDDLIRVVDKIDREVYYHAYRSKINDQNIETIFTDLDTMNSLRVFIEKTWMDAQIKDEERKVNVTRLFKIVTTKIYEIDSSWMGLNPNVKKAFNQIQNHHMSIQEQNGKNFQDLKDHFFLKIIELTDSYKSGQILILKEIYFESMNALIEIENIKIHNLQLRKRLLGSAQILSTLVNRLSENIEPLDKILKHHS